jgi:hypothetical protein
MMNPWLPLYSSTDHSVHDIPILFTNIYVLFTFNPDILKAHGIIPSIVGQKRPATAEPDTDNIKQEQQEDSKEGVDDQNASPDRIRALEVDLPYIPLLGLRNFFMV